MENRRTKSILERKDIPKKENERLKRELEKFDIEELRIENHRVLMSNGKKATFYGDLPDQYADTIYMQHAPYVEMNITSSLSPESLNYSGFAAGFIRDFSDWGEELTGKVIDTREQTAFTKKWYEVISVEIIPYPYKEVSCSGR